MTIDDETRGILQSLLDLTRGNTAQLARLEAINTLQNQVIVLLLEQAETFVNNPPELIEAYERVRAAALQTIELADDRKAFDALLSLIDQKFLGIYS